MSVQVDHIPLGLLELPSTWLAHLVQHVASGSGGLASAAALSQACKSFYTLSESSAVTYRNLHLANPVNGLDHPFFRWLAKRQGRVAGLTAAVKLPLLPDPEPVHSMSPTWSSPQSPRYDPREGRGPRSPEPVPAHSMSPTLSPPQSPSYDPREGRGPRSPVPEFQWSLMTPSYSPSSPVCYWEQQQLQQQQQQQLQVMFGIPGLHLTVHCDDVISTPDDPFVTKVLSPHGHYINHLITSIRIGSKGLTLQEFCKAAAPCRRLDLTGDLDTWVGEPLNMVDLEPLAGSLVHLNLESVGIDGLRRIESLSCLLVCSQLTSLSLKIYDLGAEEPWTQLTGLTTLKQLYLWVAASGDPSPLSALTGLSSLELISSRDPLPSALEQGGMLTPYTFSSLQPLSTLQQLEVLKLHGGQIWSAACLHGLAGLSRLETLRLEAPKLKSLSGICRRLTCLVIDGAYWLDSLAGIEHLQGLQDLSIVSSDVSSLHPLAGLGKLRNLCIGGRFASIAGLEGNLCTGLRTLRLGCCLKLRQLSGIEGLTALQELDISSCDVTSLQPIGQLVGGLKKLRVFGCELVEEEVLELPHIQPTCDVSILVSNVKEVVLAGGLRRKVDHDGPHLSWWRRRSQDLQDVTGFVWEEVA